MLRRAIAVALTVVCLAGAIVLAAPTIAVDNATYDFGTVAEGVRVTHRFVLSNAGDEALEGLQSTGTCGCTTSSLPTQTLAPGEAMDVEVTFHTEGYAGQTVNKSVYMSSNDPATPKLWLYVRGAVLAASAQPAAATDFIVFYEEGCPHCARLETTLAALAPRYPQLRIERHEIHAAGAQDLLNRLITAYGVELGSVPIAFVGDVALVGGTYYGLYGEPHAPSGRAEESALVAAIERAIADSPPSPLERAAGVKGESLAEKLTLPAILVAAALDSVNPCDFAVLVLLLGTLLVVGRRTKVLWAGLAFSAGIFVAYFSMGFGLYSLLGLTVGTRSFREPFVLAVSGLAILVGLWEMKDLLWYGKWFSIEVPEKWKPSLKRVTAAVVTIPGAFLVGMLDSLFLAPCTSGPYLVILTLLSQTATRSQGVWYLLLYNAVFILPMIAITLAVHFGMTTTARAERWRQAKLGKLHFATGLVMVVLGVGMIVGVRLGYL